ncbi:GDSL-type esterase/lipase family protein [Micrococcus luteus]|uniref:SGNH/GDSL hydrolase family protein n=1 Tax=Micrococcus luteus TaxID=1270 RepID=UPI0034344C94
MSYAKQTWTNGSGGATPLSAARLQHMEDGIEGVGLDATTTKWAPRSPDLAVEATRATSLLTGSTIAVTFGTGAATTISGGVEAANLGSPAGKLALIGTNAAGLDQPVAGVWAANWKAAADGTSGTLLYPTTSFGVEFWVVGTRYVELNIMTVPGPYIQFWVDDRKTSDLPLTSGTWVDYNANTVKLDLGDASMHKVRVMMNGIALGKVWTQANGTVFASEPEPGRRFMVVGDSHSAGTVKNTGYELGAWLPIFANLAGIADYWNGAIAGTGPNQTSTGYPNYKTRATQDVVPNIPDVVLVAGWLNDKVNGRSAANIAADMTTIITTIKVGSPATRIIVGGSIDPAGANGTDYTNIDAAVKSVCATAGVEFVSPTTGEIVSAAGTVLRTTAPWINTANKAALIGDDNLHYIDVGAKYMAARWLEAWKALIGA